MTDTLKNQVVEILANQETYHWNFINHGASCVSDNTICRVIMFDLDRCDVDIMNSDVEEITNMLDAKLATMDSRVFLGLN